MKRQPWCPVQSLSIRVRHGFVDLNGTIFDARERQALHVLVENVHGVKGIRDHLGEFVSAAAQGAGRGGAASRATT
jgi:osmotically-inducible protein OsmY